MSRNFQVLPSTPIIPSYSEVLSLANNYINEYLPSIGIVEEISAQVNLQNISTHKLLNTSTNNKIIHNQIDYAWFFILGVAGGTGCYFHKNIPIDKEAWLKDIENNENAHKYEKLIMQNLSIGYSWTFRESAGQHGIISLIQGMLAAALASLTGGLVYSDDTVIWSESRFPETPEVFRSWYFNPDFASSAETRNFLNRRIAQVVSTFA